MTSALRSTLRLSCPGLGEEPRTMQRVMDERMLAIHRQTADALRRSIRWHAAEVRYRVSLCRARFTPDRSDAVTKARRSLYRYAEAWTDARGHIRELEMKLAEPVVVNPPRELVTQE